MNSYFLKRLCHELRGYISHLAIKIRLSVKNPYNNNDNNNKYFNNLLDKRTYPEFTVMCIKYYKGVLQIQEYIIIMKYHL